MREIKYKAWDLKNKKWLNLWQILFSEDGEAKAVKDINGERFGLNQVELLECTGLRDKNGKEIYEGDILKIDDIEDDSIFFVSFDDGCFVADYSWEEKLPKPTLVQAMYPFSDFKIVGNIYENPELLK